MRHEIHILADDTAVQHGTDRDIPGIIDQAFTAAPGTPMRDTPGAFIVSPTPAPDERAHAAAQRRGDAPRGGRR